MSARPASLARGRIAPAACVLCLALGGASVLLAQTIGNTDMPPRSALLSGALDLYASGRFDEAVNAFARTQVDDGFVDSVRRDAPVWVSAAAPPNRSRRRVAAAALLLELLQDQRSVRVGPPPATVLINGNAYAYGGQRRDPKGWVPGHPYQRLLEAACGLLREEKIPLPAERIWHDAAIALVESLPEPDTLDRHLAHAEQRFPGDGRVTLARAVVAEQRTWPDTRDDAGQRTLAKASMLPALFERAAARPDVRAEAEIRWGYYELRLKHADAALAHFDKAEPGPDLFLTYLGHLLRGRALEQAGRVDDAVASYRLAHHDVPEAQSASLALSGALVRGNQRLEATAVAHDAVTTAVPGLDPWLEYGAGDRRLWPLHLAQLRAAVVAR